MYDDGSSLLPARKVIDAQAAADQLGVSLSMAYKLLHLGELEGYSVGRRKLIYADSIEAFRSRKAIGRAPAPVRVKEPTPRQRRRKEPVKVLELPARRHLR